MITLCIFSIIRKSKTTFPPILVPEGTLSSILTVRLAKDMLAQLTNLNQPKILLRQLKFPTWKHNKEHSSHTNLTSLSFQVVLLSVLAFGQSSKICLSRFIDTSCKFQISLLLYVCFLCILSCKLILNIFQRILFCKIFWGGVLLQRFSHIMTIRPWQLWHESFYRLGLLILMEVAVHVQVPSIF